MYVASRVTASIGNTHQGYDAAKEEAISRPLRLFADCSCAKYDGCHVKGPNEVKVRQRLHDFERKHGVHQNEAYL